MSGSDPREDFVQIDRWLDRLLDASPAERTQILSACADTTLRERLCTLLAAEAQSGPLDETPQTLARTVLDAGAARAAEAHHGARMGAYRIAHLLGEGGSATVWLGTRDDGAITHEVAVKCLKSGLATPEQRARFVREQQILARLAHPHIARLFD
ncbi:MAG: protein kinase, partial [Lysobacter sp.]|nr:protein kinase [Lysobacter sp.]